MGLPVYRADDYTEDRFRALFGPGRSTGSGVGREALLLSELEVAFTAPLAHDETFLHYVAGGPRHLFVTVAGQLAYSSTIADWQADATAQLQALSAACCPAQRVFSEGYGREYRAVSAVSGETVCFGVDGEHARIIGVDDEELLYWSADEFTEDPDLVCGALVGALGNGASLN